MATYGNPISDIRNPISDLIFPKSYFIFPKSHIIFNISEIRYPKSDAYGNVWQRMATYCDVLLVRYDLITLKNARNHSFNGPL